MRLLGSTPNVSTLLSRPFPFSDWTLVAWEAKALLRKGQYSVIEYSVFHPKTANETVKIIKPESEETEASDYDEDEGRHK